MCTRHTDPGREEGRGRRESASAHTGKGHAGNTRRAARPSQWNAQTAWNGVPAGGGKVHPARTTHHTQRGERGAGGWDGEDPKPSTGPNPPDLPRAPRTHEQGTAHAKAVVVHRATYQPSS